MASSSSFFGFHDGDGSLSGRAANVHLNPVYDEACYQEEENDDGTGGGAQQVVYDSASAGFGFFLDGQQEAVADEDDNEYQPSSGYLTVDGDHGYLAVDGATEDQPPAAAASTTKNVTSSSNDASTAWAFSPKQGAVFQNGVDGAEFPSSGLVGVGGPKSGGSGGGWSRRRTLVAVLGLVLLVGIAVGVAVGVGQASSSSNSAPQNTFQSQNPSEDPPQASEQHFVFPAAVSFDLQGDFASIASSKGSFATNVTNFLGEQLGIEDATEHITNVTLVPGSIVVGFRTLMRSLVVDLAKRLAEGPLEFEFKGNVFPVIRNSLVSRLDVESPAECAEADDCDSNVCCGAFCCAAGQICCAEQCELPDFSADGEPECRALCRASEQSEPGTCATGYGNQQGEACVVDDNCDGSLLCCNNACSASSIDFAGAAVCPDDCKVALDAPEGSCALGFDNVEDEACVSDGNCADGLSCCDESCQEKISGMDGLVCPAVCKLEEDSVAGDCTLGRTQVENEPCLSSHNCGSALECCDGVCRQLLFDFELVLRCPGDCKPRSDAEPGGCAPGDADGGACGLDRDCESLHCCPPDEGHLQQKLQDFCNQVEPGFVPRFSTGLASQTTRQWRCYDVASLDFDVDGQCVSNSGALVPCAGERTGADGRHRTRSGLDQLIAVYTGDDKQGTCCAADADCCFGECTVKQESFDGTLTCPSQCKLTDLAPVGSCYEGAAAGQTCLVSGNCANSLSCCGGQCCGGTCCNGVCCEQEGALCCDGACAVPLFDHASTPRCEADCKITAAAPAGSCYADQGEGDECDVEENCAAGLLCCSNLCEAPSLNHDGTQVCFAACQITVAAEAGSCFADVSEGGSCQVDENCESDLLCCSGSCTTAALTLASELQCPETCRVTPSAPEGSCFYLVSEGGFCEVEANCAEGLPCCGNRCTNPALAADGQPACPDECRALPSIPPGSCVYDRAPGQACFGEVNCADTNACCDGVCCDSGYACCADTEVQGAHVCKVLVGNHDGSQVCPEVCRASPTAPDGSCLQDKGADGDVCFVNDHCVSNTCCGGHCCRPSKCCNDVCCGNDHSCCQGACAALVPTLSGDMFCPHECQATSQSPPGSCSFGYDNAEGAACAVDQNCLGDLVCCPGDKTCCAAALVGPGVPCSLAAASGDDHAAAACESCNVAATANVHVLEYPARFATAILDATDASLASRLRNLGDGAEDAIRDALAERFADLEAALGSAFIRAEASVRIVPLADDASTGDARVCVSVMHSSIRGTAYLGLVASQLGFGSLDESPFGSSFSDAVLEVLPGLPDGSSVDSLLAPTDVSGVVTYPSPQSETGRRSRRSTEEHAGACAANNQCTLASTCVDRSSTGTHYCNPWKAVGSTFYQFLFALTNANSPVFSFKFLLGDSGVTLGFKFYMQNKAWRLVVSSNYFSQLMPFLPDGLSVLGQITLWFKHGAAVSPVMLLWFGALGGAGKASKVLSCESFNPIGSKYHTYDATVHTACCLAGAPKSVSKGVVLGTCTYRKDKQGRYTCSSPTTPDDTLLHSDYCNVEDAKTLWAQSDARKVQLIDAAYSDTTGAVRCRNVGKNLGKCYAEILKQVWKGKWQVDLELELVKISLDDIGVDVPWLKNLVFDASVKVRNVGSRDDSATCSRPYCNPFVPVGRPELPVKSGAKLAMTDLTFRVKNINLVALSAELWLTYTTNFDTKQSCSLCLGTPNNCPFNPSTDCLGSGAGAGKSSMSSADWASRSSSMSLKDPKSMLASYVSGSSPAASSRRRRSTQEPQNGLALARRAIDPNEHGHKWAFKLRLHTQRINQIMCTIMDFYGDEACTETERAGTGEGARAWCAAFWSSVPEALCTMLMYSTVQGAGDQGLYSTFPNMQRMLGRLDSALKMFVLDSGDLSLETESYVDVDFTIGKEAISALTGIQVDLTLPTFPVPVKITRPLKVAASFARKKLTGRRRERRLSTSDLSSAFGLELNAADFESIFNAVLGDVSSDALGWVKNAAGTITGLAVVVTLTELRQGSLSRPDLDTIATLQHPIPPGASIVLQLTLPAPSCDTAVCGFVRQHLGEPKVYLMASAVFGKPAEGSSSKVPTVSATFTAALGDVEIPWRDECGRAYLTLTEMALSATFGATTGYGFSGTLTWRPPPRSNAQYTCDDTIPSLAFTAMMSQVTQIVPDPDDATKTVPKSTLTLTAAMKGIWTEAFGWDFLHFGNLQFSASLLPPAFTVVGFEVGGTLDLGRNCYIENPDEPGELMRNADAQCVGATVLLGLPENKLNTYFVAELYGFSVLQVIKTFASASYAARFEASAPGWLQDLGFPEIESGEPNPQVSLAFNPVGMLTRTGIIVPGGLYVRGLLSLFGLEVSAEVSIKAFEGISLKADVSPIQWAGGAIRMQRSATDEAGPTFSLSVDYTQLPVTVDAYFAGHVELLGMSKTVTIQLTNTGFEFVMIDKLFSVFTTTLTVSASFGSLADLAFSVRGSLSADFGERIATDVASLLGTDINEALQELDDANTAVDQAAEAVEDATTALADAKTERAAADKALSDQYAEIALLEVELDATGASEVQDALDTARAELPELISAGNAAAATVQEAQQQLSAAEDTHASAQLEAAAVLNSDHVQAALAASDIGDVVSDIFTLHEASFMVAVSTAEGREFGLTLDFTFLGRRYSGFSFVFNFNDVGGSIARLFQDVFLGGLQDFVRVAEVPLGGECVAHHNCANFGLGATAVACCQSECAHKVKDAIGIGWCPHEVYKNKADNAVCILGRDFECSSLKCGRHSFFSTRCCPSGQSRQIGGLDYCDNLPLDSGCAYDQQCQSGLYCSNGKCRSKKGDGQSCSLGKDAECASGVCGRYSLFSFRCCPGGDATSITGLDYCSALPNDEGCTHDAQCLGYCSDIGIPTKCKPKKANNEACTFGKDSECASNICGRHSEASFRCCSSKVPYDGKDYCGDLPVGSGCALHSQCVSTAYCAGFFDNNLQGAECKPKKDEHEGCQNNEDCNSNVCAKHHVNKYCCGSQHDGKCKGLPNGKGCTDDYQCSSGLCDAWQCKAKSSDGATCTIDNQCVNTCGWHYTGKYCCGSTGDGDRCKGLSLDSGCTRDWQCTTNVCDGWKCRNKKNVHDSCNHDHWCTSGICAKHNTGKYCCTARHNDQCKNLPNGKGCTDNYQCTSGLCEGWQCKAKKSNGHGCTYDNQCTNTCGWHYTGKYCCSSTGDGDRCKGLSVNSGCSRDWQCTTNVCDGWKCRSKRNEHDSCKYDHWCTTGICAKHNSGKYCCRSRRDGKCKNLPNGKGCSDSWQCSSGWCTSWKCKEKLNSGDWCGGDWQCKSNDCAWYKKCK